MAYIEWFDKLSTHINEVDLQHQKLISLLNELYDSLRKGAAKSAVDQVLDELVRYAIYHFNTEEALMTKYAYPGYEFHKKEHESFKASIQEFLEKEAKRKVISIDLLLFLKDWLIKHIIVVDKKMGAYLFKKLKEESDTFKSL